MLTESLTVLSRPYEKPLVYRSQISLSAGIGNLACGYEHGVLARHRGKRNWAAGVSGQMFGHGEESISTQTKNCARCCLVGAAHV